MWGAKVLGKPDGGVMVQARSVHKIYIAMTLSEAHKRKMGVVVYTRGIHLGPQFGSSVKNNPCRDFSS